MLGSKADFYGNYPPGAANDLSAPYNQVDLPTKEVDVLCSQTLDKDVHLNKADYDPYEEDFVDLKDSYEEEAETPLSIINKFKKVLETGKLPTHKDYWIDQCKGWTDTETIVEQE